MSHQSINAMLHTHLCLSILFLFIHSPFAPSSNSSNIHTYDFLRSEQKTSLLESNPLPSLIIQARMSSASLVWFRDFCLFQARHHIKVTIAEIKVTSTIVEMAIEGWKAPLVCQQPSSRTVHHDLLGFNILWSANDLDCQDGYEAIDSVLSFRCDAADQLYSSPYAFDSRDVMIDSL
jgi:hypothetical protein